MGFFRACERKLRQQLRFTPAARDAARDESGLALFMVMAAMTVLALLVTEFTYVAQVNQRIAYDGADQLKAHYLAKSGYKLSLLRLKAYEKIKSALSSKGVADKVPRKLLDQVWAFPFMFPIPEMPGMTSIQKDQLRKFQAGSGLDGNFTALIESESAKFNLNQILAPYAAEPPAPTGATGPSGPRNSPPPNPNDPNDPNDPENPNGPNNPNGTGTKFNPDAARDSLKQYLMALFQDKAASDRDFEGEYPQYVMDELAENIYAWADWSYENQNWKHDVIPPKRAPFYSITELRMIPPMDDTLYELFAPALTVSKTPGINVNTMKDPTLKALVPGITEEEIKKFFEFRDSQEEDNTFKDEESFIKWLGENVEVLMGAGEIRRFQEDLKKRNIYIIVEESVFKISVRAQVNNATKVLEAWVNMAASKKDSKKRPGGDPGGDFMNSVAGSGGAAQCTRDPSLKVTFMRIF